MSKFYLLTAVVPHGKAELISNAAVEAGSFGGTVCIGRSISSNNVIAALGLGSETRDLVYILTENPQHSAIVKSILKVCENEKSNFGYMYILESSKMLKTGNISEGELDMSFTPTNELITIILNKGYADDAMAAARKAGAGGGTVINARGTAREDDEKFFGMHIVPEKEMLMIIVDNDKKDAVLEAIKTLPCLSEPGSGIVFNLPIQEFYNLGKTLAN